MKAIVVMTTINNPQNLKALLKQLPELIGPVSSGFEDEIIIALDRKTPAFKVNDPRVTLLTVRDQVRMCKNPIGVPFDCIQRRNMAYIAAIRRQPDVIITIDDDNFPSNAWLLEHKQSVGEIELDIVNSTPNVIKELLDTQCALHKECSNVLHRGYSFNRILLNTAVAEKKSVWVGVNAGLWAGDPDINAYDRKLHPGVNTNWKNFTKSCGVHPKHYHPFNSQNTAVVRNLFPTLFLIPMYETIYGKKIGRYDDIWQSYICQRIMKKYDMYVKFGTPYVKQERNDHSINKDLEEEYVGMMVTNDFIEFLDGITLYSDYPFENMYEIADKLMLTQHKVFKYIGEKMLWWLSEIKEMF